MHLETISPTCLRLVSDLANLDFTEDFYLVGGTALALQIGHRTSIDLDFFSTQEFDPTSWRADFETIAEVKDLRSRKNNIIGSLNDVKVEYLHFAYPPRFPLVEWNGIKMINPTDIGLFKILAILGRNRKKDIIDLYFIDKYVQDIRQILKTFTEKYDEGDVNLLKQLEILFDDEEVEKSSMPMMLMEVDWKQAYTHVKEKLTNAIIDELGL